MVDFLWMPVCLIYLVLPGIQLWYILLSGQDLIKRFLCVLISVG